MSSEGDSKLRLARASLVVTVLAAVASSYLLLFDSSSSWLDRAMAFVLLAFAAYGIKTFVTGALDELIAGKEPRRIWDIVMPFVFPFFLISWADERESPPWALVYFCS